MDIDVGSLKTVAELNSALSDIENYEAVSSIAIFLQMDVRTINLIRMLEKGINFCLDFRVFVVGFLLNFTFFLSNLVPEEVGVDLLSHFTTLHERAVKSLFSTFDEACRISDEKEVIKLFQLFPLVNESDAGVAKFGAFLAEKFSAKVEAQLALLALKSQPSKPTDYVDIMTEFLENVAQVVQSNEQILNECFGEATSTKISCFIHTHSCDLAFLITYAGSGSLFKLIRAVQQQCDEKTALIFLNFKEKRQLSVAVQRARHELTMGSRPPPVSGPSVATGQGTTSAIFDYCLSSEALVSEIVLLNARIELFLNFLRRRLLTRPMTLAVLLMSCCVKHLLNAATQLPFNAVAQIKQFFADFQLVKISQELVDAYLPQEQLFLRELVNKAILMDEVDQTTRVFSMVDEVFFVIQKCLSRAISSGNIDAVCAMLNYSASVLADQFINDVLTSRSQQCTSSGWIQQAYNLVHKRAGSGTLKTGLLGNGSSGEGHSSNNQNGKLSTSDSQVQYLFTLNSLEACLKCLQVLKTTLQHLVKDVFGLRPESDLSKLQTCLSDLFESLERSFHQLLDNGFEQLRGVIRPQIATLTQPLASVKRELAEEELDQFASNDPWMESLIIGLQNLLKPFQVSFPCCFPLSLQFGALQLDKELRLLFNFFTSLSMFPCREKFARILQISKLLNLETVEEVSYYGNTSNWKLSANEIRRLLTLR
ncbi:unnamed protein product [Schistocephalus solidus]|uniref:Conserved oligomeric Golgi complex subunit 4 n=1 Tax=Schistocephalus solidus TaxID=70667 RepID=A0A183T6F9_SCHSO|nr:unnamed protein product [Schistocephalus solidus]